MLITFVLFTLKTSAQYSQKQIELLGNSKINNNNILLNNFAKSNKASQSIFNVGVVAGIGYNKIKIISDTITEYILNPAIIKTGGVFLEFPMSNFLDGRFKVYNELSFSTFSAKKTYDYSDTVDSKINKYHRNITFSPGSISLHNVVRCFFSENDFKYFIGIGIYNSFIFASDNINYLSVTEENQFKEIKTDAIPKLSRYGFSMTASTGFNYRNVSLELRFDPGVNYSNHMYYKAYSYAFHAFLSYSIFNNQ